MPWRLCQFYRNTRKEALVQVWYKGLQKAKELGFQAVVVLGHPDYYPKCGFKPASGWGIKCPYEAPDEAFMALELEKGALNNVSGLVKYSSGFNGF